MHEVDIPGMERTYTTERHNDANLGMNLAQLDGKSRIYKHSEEKMVLGTRVFFCSRETRQADVT